MSTVRRLASGIVYLSDVRRYSRAHSATELAAQTERARLEAEARARSLMDEDLEESDPFGSGGGGFGLARASRIRARLSMLSVTAANNTPRGSFSAIGGSTPSSMASSRAITPAPGLGGAGGGSNGGRQGAGLSTSTSEDIKIGEGNTTHASPFTQSLTEKCVQAGLAAAWGPESATFPPPAPPPVAFFEGLSTSPSPPPGRSPGLAAPLGAQIRYNPADPTGTPASTSTSTALVAGAGSASLLTGTSGLPILQRRASATGKGKGGVGGPIALIGASDNPLKSESGRRGSMTSTTNVANAETVNVDVTAVVPVPAGQERFSVKANAEVYLGGSCHPTTWRRDIAIPVCEARSVTYYNPQIDDWTPDLVSVEAKAKEESSVLFFVIDNRTRAIGSMLEASEYIGRYGSHILPAHSLSIVLC